MRLKATEEKIHSTEAFCEITRYLLSNPLSPVVAGKDAREQLENHRLQKNIVAHMLCAIIVENTIKYSGKWNTIKNVSTHTIFIKSTENFPIQQEQN